MARKKTDVKTKSSAPPKLQLAAEVAKRIQIDDLRLVETHVAQQLRDAQLPSQLEISVQTQSRADEETSRIAVDVRAQLCAQYDMDDPAHPAPIEISARFRVTYIASSLGGLTDEHIEAFGELNGVYNVWPYWREYVQAVIARMGLPPLTLPVFRPLERAGKRSGTEERSAANKERLAANKERLAANKKRLAAKKERLAAKKRTDSTSTHARQ